MLHITVHLEPPCGSGDSDAFLRTVGLAVDQLVAYCRPAGPLARYPRQKLAQARRAAVQLQEALAGLKGTGNGAVRKPKAGHSRRTRRGRTPEVRATARERGRGR